MTKLEEKLIELGYNNVYFNCYKKKFFRFIFITLELKNDKIWFYSVADLNNCFVTQQDIDSLQQVFNEMQKDLEVLRKYEKD